MLIRLPKISIFFLHSTVLPRLSVPRLSVPRLSVPRLSGRSSIFWGDYPVVFLGFSKKNLLLLLSAEGKFDLQYVPPGFLGEVY